MSGTVRARRHSFAPTKIGRYKLKSTGASAPVVGDARSTSSTSHDSEKHKNRTCNSTSRKNKHQLLFLVLNMVSRVKRPYDTAADGYWTRAGHGMIPLVDAGQEQAME